VAPAASVFFHGEVGNTDTPVTISGKLSVRGTKLCDSNGDPVQLRGMSTHGLQWFSQCINDDSLDALAQDWNADVLRIALYIQEGGYQQAPEHFTDLVHQYVEAATQRGMYAIIDWHVRGDPEVHREQAKVFFTEVATRHRDKPNVLYEIANEPDGVAWSRIKNYAEDLIPVIRRQDPASVVLVGTRAWSSLGIAEGADEREVVDNPVRAGNILYTFHFFAASHGAEYFDTLSRAADRLPLFVSEFGTQTFSGDGADDFAMSEHYLRLMDRKKIGWTNWNYSDDGRSGAAFRQGTCPAGPWTGTTPLKPAGAWVREHLRRENISTPRGWHPGDGRSRRIRGSHR
jgi:endoglucanase